MLTPVRIDSLSAPLPLHDSAATRQVEAAALARSAPFALMARAGLACARLALALWPHAQRIWIAAGPGNNGGDGLVAARHLHLAGRQVQVSWTGQPDRLPADARRAHAEALSDSVSITDRPPSGPVDLAIDALLGLGQRRAPEGRIAESVRALNACGAPVLALDLPTGLCADTGRRLDIDSVTAHATLSLLTLKPGLLTADGRDAAGSLWLDDLGQPPASEGASAVLNGCAAAWTARPERPLGSHKGRFGDLWVIGGAPGMAGAARLAAHAGLLAGAGRSYLCRLDGDTSPDPRWPELMTRSADAWQADRAASASTVVCGCGGGQAVREHLPAVLHSAARLVLDADALNAIAADSALQQALRARRHPTVLTPHPLEAARLLGCDTDAVQADRLASAQRLAEQTGACVVLKGSGSVIAAPGRMPRLNASGNGRLATAGSGDVLAGWLGGQWASEAGADAMTVASAVVWLHGQAVEGPAGLPLPAGELATAMAATASALHRAR